MAKITYTDKQTAVNPASPASNEVFTADDANMIKTVVNGLDDAMGTVNKTVHVASTTTVTLTWSDTVPAETKTYAQKHGTAGIRVTGESVLDGSSFNPDYIVTRSAGAITVVTINNVAVGDILTIM